MASQPGFSIELFRAPLVQALKRSRSKRRKDDREKNKAALEITVTVFVYSGQDRRGGGAA